MNPATTAKIIVREQCTNKQHQEYRCNDLAHRLTQRQWNVKSTAEHELRKLGSLLYADFGIHHLER